MSQLGFTFYPKDWWTSDSFFLLQPFERYIYLECLFMMYSNDGWISNNKLIIERRLGTTIKDEVWSKITDLMVEDGGQFTHESVNKRLRKTLANRENGKNGGRPEGEVDIFCITGKKVPTEVRTGHFIYLIHDAVRDEYKIGETQNLKKRRQTIKRPTKDLSVYHFEISDAATCQNIERQVLQVFKNQRISGDWLKLSKHDLDSVLNLISIGVKNPKNQPKNPPLEREREIEREIERRVINNSFVSINFDESVQNFQGNKKHFFLAYIFWELWYKENPNSRTMRDAKVGKWVDEIRKIVEIDKTSVERMIGIYCYFSKCAKQELGFDDFWFRTVKSVASFRKKNKAGVYYIDQIIDKVNDKRDKDKDFLRYVDAAITKFNKNEKLK